MEKDPHLALAERLIANKGQVSLGDLREAERLIREEEKTPKPTQQENKQ